MATSKKVRKDFTRQPLFLAIIGVLVGVVGTLAVQYSFAAKYVPRLLLDADTPNPVHMGDTVTFRPYYKNGEKNPAGVLTCWHLDNTPSGWPDYNGNPQPTGTPIFSKTISPLPPSGQKFQVALGAANSGPAICYSELYSGGQWQSRSAFGTL